MLNNKNGKYQNSSIKATAQTFLGEKASSVVITFSKEAIICFKKELSEIHDDINDEKSLKIETYPLEKDPCPNQAIGFYITPDSPTLMISINSLARRKEDLQNFDFDDKLDCLDQCTHDAMQAEQNEKSLKNIVDIVVFDAEGNNISCKCGAVVIEINREGIRKLIYTLTLLENDDGKGVLLEREMQDVFTGDLRLSQDSLAVIMRCKDLGKVYDYDPRFKDEAI